MRNIPLVECNNVSLKLDNNVLLQDISFSLRNGENLVILGPNGAGKTILLSMLSGNLPPDKGDVCIMGKPLYAKEGYKIKKEIGFVSPKMFEDYDYSSIVSDIVASGLFGSIGLSYDPQKNSNKAAMDYINRVVSAKYKDTKVAYSLMQKFGIAHLEKHRFGQLSYGEKIRVLIVRCLINNPRLFIFDEPTTGLDIQMRAQFCADLTLLSHETEIIFVTHHLEEIPETFKRVLLLKQGRLFGFGDKKTMLTGRHLSKLLSVDVSVQNRDGKYFALF
jgi:iron complex transport system ATP-binding protein